MKIYLLALHSFLLSSTLCFLPIASSENTHVIRKYYINSLRSGLEAFTDILITKPRSYTKIAEVFDEMVTFLDNAPPVQSLVATVLKEKFTQRSAPDSAGNDHTISINYIVINDVLQELWDKKKAQLTSQEKQILKQYKAYNAQHHGSDNKLCKYTIGALAIISIAATIDTALRSSKHSETVKFAGISAFFSSLFGFFCYTDALLTSVISPDFAD